jgi:hypothetical protein
MKFCIMKETAYAGIPIKNWVVDCHDGRSTKMTSANRPAPDDFLYDSREVAEADMANFITQDENLAGVKKLSKKKVVLSKFSVVEVEA